MATHAGMTTAEYEAIVREWIATAKGTAIGQPYTSMVYQPMLELAAYLRANGFKTYIVSGGGVEFMRPWTEKVYGIPPEQVVGSSIKTKFELRNGKPVLMRLPELSFIDDGAGKPVGINEHIGRRLIFAFGNPGMAICKCCNGPRRAAVRGSWALFITRTAFANGHTTASRASGNSTRRSMRLRQRAGRSWDMKLDWKVIFTFEKQ